MRIALLATALSAALVSLATADPAAAAIKTPTNIAPQELGSALRVLAADRHLQILYTTDSIANRRTPGAVGEFTVDEALDHLLGGTDLVFRYIDENTIAIMPRGAAPGGDPTRSYSSPETAAPQAAVKESQQTSADAEKAPGSFWNRFRLAQTDRGVAREAASLDRQHNPNAQRDSGQGAPLEEVLVTAEKRSERIQDVPVPVTSMSADALISSNQVRLQDYYTGVPGLNVSPATQSQTTISIRGISTGAAANPSVGITVDDVPFGSSTQNGGGPIVPDIDPADLARIEVLRGPQGALYGASSIGGLLKYVTVDPSTDAFSGRVQGGLSGVANGAELGYEFRASVNMPVSDTIAIRASAFTRQDPGYIDNPTLPLRGVNEDHIGGGRLAALWRPSDTLSLKLSALIQVSRGDGSSDVVFEPGLGDLQQNYARGVGAYVRKVQAYGAVLNTKIGDAELTSVTGYNINSFDDSFDFTYALGPYSQTQFNTPDTAVANENRTNKFTQEVRLNIPFGTRFEWLLGGFYTYERSQYYFHLPALNHATGAVAGYWWSYAAYPSTYAEYAGFTDLTVHFTDRFDVQVGGRGNHIAQTNSEIIYGPYDPIFLGVPSPAVYPQVDTHNGAFTYLVTPRLKLTPDILLYARLASGYRPGGPNPIPGVPNEYAPDKTQNYEIGLKGDFFQHALTLDASLYDIDWKNIQLSLIDPQNLQEYTANASRARSKGLELSVESRPLKGLVISGWVAFNDAKLTEGFPATSTVLGVPGERLPYASRFSGNLSVQQDFPLWSTATGFVGATVSYVGDRKGEFSGTDARTDLPAYTKADLRAGVKYDSWSADLFATNIANRRGLLAGGTGYQPPDAYQYIQPRTIGLSITRTF